MVKGLSQALMTTEGVFTDCWALANHLVVNELGGEAMVTEASPLDHRAPDNWAKVVQVRHLSRSTWHRCVDGLPELRLWCQGATNTPFRVAQMNWGLSKSLLSDPSLGRIYKSVNADSFPGAIPPSAPRVTNFVVKVRAWLECM